MLNCLCRGIASGGHEVVAPIDERLLKRTRSDLQNLVSIRSVPTQASVESVCAIWRELANRCDKVIVIAPEIDQVLKRVIDYLSGAESELVNCTSTFLDNASDKALMAAALTKANVDHPPTRLLSELSDDWLRTVQSDMNTDRWIVKPRDGAGCSSLSISRSIFGLQEAVASSVVCESDNFIVQPWISGVPLSCSAIVDTSGHWHWMPLTTQTFKSHPQLVGAKSSDSVTQLTYSGSRMASPWYQERRPDATLSRIATGLGPGATGWVSVDLVYHTQDDLWYVIEVNSRCTSSLVCLEKSYDGNLQLEIIASREDRYCGPSDTWQPASSSRGIVV